MSRTIIRRNRTENAIPNLPSLLGRSVFDDIFENVLIDFPAHLKNSTSGYPVTDIYQSEDGSSVLELALAGFSKDELSIDIQPRNQTITVSAKSSCENNNSHRRIAKRSFCKTYVNYDNNLDLTSSRAEFTNGLLVITVPTKEKVKPISLKIN
jgi:HSP20 family molecular chaperone IbpA